MFVMIVMFHMHVNGIITRRLLHIELHENNSFLFDLGPEWVGLG